MTKRYNQDEEKFKWSQWSPDEGMIRCGIASYHQIMIMMQELGADAKRCVKKSDKPHAIYGMTVHDFMGRITEIRLFADNYVSDGELEAIAKGHPLNTLYVAHK